MPHGSFESCLPFRLSQIWKGSRQNLLYNSNGEIVYPAACVGVVMTKRTLPQRHEQTFHLDHTQVGSMRVKMMLLNPKQCLNGAVVATGEAGRISTITRVTSIPNPLHIYS